MPRRGSGSPYDHAWRQLRLVILERDGFRCRIGAEGCTVKATEVDHIVALEDGGARLDPDNLRASCARCNRGRFMRDVKRLRVAAEGPVGPAGPSREW